MQKVQMIMEFTPYSVECMQLRACMCARLHKGVQFVPSKSACLHAGLLDCFLDDQQQYHGQAFIAAKVALLALRCVGCTYITSWIRRTYGVDDSMCTWKLHLFHAWWHSCC
jgi:hypothetical protein